MGQLYVVGIGPGAYEQMTIKAARALEACDIIVGYAVYVELIAEHFPGKRFVTTGMRQEEERCIKALEYAAEGSSVAVICSGDAGVYGMAGLIYTLGTRYPDVNIEIVSGVTAACSGAAILGAPLMHDFAVISLSDLMTDWSVIERRIAAAAAADMCICLYNPSSRKRRAYLKRACNIILKHASCELVCGVARAIGREEESCTIMSLKELLEYDVDMFTTVFIGNSTTRQIGGRMVTPRGYSVEL